jgi:hypothetical protein
VAERANQYTRETSVMAARLQRTKFDLLAFDTSGLNRETGRAVGVCISALDVLIDRLTPKPRAAVLADVPPAKGGA